MKRFVDLLTPLGLLVVAGAAIAARRGLNLPGGLRPWLVGGFALVVLHLVLRWEDVYRTIGRRQLRYGTNTAVMVLLVLGILGAVNWMANRRSIKKDLTKNQRYSLSDQTRKVVQGLKDEVRLVYFQRGSDMQGAGVDRVRDFGALSPNLKVEFVDPMVKPTRARELGVQSVPTVVVERGDKRERVTTESEQDLTNAILKVTREGKRVVCFVEGEGEKDLDDSGDTGFSGAKAALTRDQYETKKVLLVRERTVPADCTVLVVAGPQTDLLPAVSDAIQAYVKAGGKALLLSDPELKSKRPTYDALLKAFNIQPGPDVVVDVSGYGQLFGAGELTPIAVQYPFHEITRNFRVMTAYHEARSMKAGQGGGPEGIFAQDIVQTSEQSWAETDLTMKAPVQADEKDTRGPISLGAAATVKVAEAPETSPAPAAAPSAAPGASPAPSPSPSPEEDKAPAKEGRVVAFGDSDFASNALLGFQGNRDLFLNAIAWLSQDSDMISIRPREPEDQRLVLTEAQRQNIFLLALILLPGLFVVLGVRAWWVLR